jgi:hypothetical protein
VRASVTRTFFLAILAEAYSLNGQTDEGLDTITEALALVQKNEERWYKAELHRLKGERTLQKFRVSGFEF